MTALTMDSYRFFRAWMRDPLRVASITPSGKALADLIVREIGPQTGRVIELGPGTGVFTRALLRRGVAEEDIILVEKGPEFAALLQQRFPKAVIACTDAAKIARFCAEPAGAAISGLPLLSMRPSESTTGLSIALASSISATPVACARVARTAPATCGAHRSE